ncbi:N-acyl-D-amino-acid deacylase family protein [Halioxenophilus sp. WMMB6]|uniref:N-acyl-D-amino-acid deacylase family protein n=1 Tax=Halioxenophilus sp. WMMB6 TaxID=3073815 RepID=UPI00295F31D4|nr:amidohydrolase family protein [Halioxenophilus sp. WMMB6]
MIEQVVDLVVRNGTVIDGSGGEPFTADIAVQNGKIVAIGKVHSKGHTEIDAKGKMVTPGFIDIHTHYDGQITWENTLNPSSGHGVTTVVMGNCGVGFAPAAPHQRELIMKLMEGVEDVPMETMAEGIPWNWETFPEYLDALDQRQADIDFIAQLPHNPLRVYVMGERGANGEPATEEDLATMRRLTKEAIQAGAFGVSTTRNHAHRFRDGRLAPSVTADEREIMALADGLGDAGTGVFELLCDAQQTAEEQVGFLREIADHCQRPITFSLLKSVDQPDAWRKVAASLNDLAAEGYKIQGQIIPRPVGILIGLNISLHPFAFHPSFRKIEHLPLAEKVAAMRDLDFRKQLLSEQADDPHDYFKTVVEDTNWLFPLGDPPNYHPAMADSIAGRARALGLDPMEVIYDELLKDNGHALLYRPSANRDGDLFEGVGELLLHCDHTVLGLGDGGAHYSMVCDAAYPTYFLTHWVDHADPKKNVPLPQAIKKLTSDPANAIGLDDRGRLQVGLKADLNIIDLEQLSLHAPRVAFDLPASGRRLIQKADGYVATIVAGEITYRDGQATGNFPGRLVRANAR